jgi:CelD/BcsL family acetyltransferase involved in cellulose biosynthesis
LVSASLAEIAPTWRHVEQRISNDGVANSWAWTELWLRHYGDLVPHRFVIAELDGPCAIALLTEGIGQRRGPFPIRTLHLGTAGEPDGETVRVQYNRLLAAPEHRVDFAHGIGAIARKSRLSWDELRLDGFDPAEAESFISGNSDFVVERKIDFVTELAEVRAAGKSVLEGLDSHAAKKLRRAVRNIEQAHGPITVEIAASLDGARSIYDEMVALHQARWHAEGLPGVFASQRFAGFHRDLVERLFPAGGIWLTRVRAGDVTLGCDYSLVERNRVLGYQWGTARLPDNRLSPGIVMGLYSMEAALQHGFHEYDWLSGDVFYKRQLSTTAREMIWARSSRGLRINGIHALERAKKSIERVRASRSGVVTAGA